MRTATDPTHSRGPEPSTERSQVPQLPLSPSLSTGPSFGNASSVSRLAGVAPAQDFPEFHGLGSSDHSDLLQTTSFDMSFPDVLEISEQGHYEKPTRPPNEAGMEGLMPSLNPFDFTGDDTDDMDCTDIHDIERLVASVAPGTRVECDHRLLLLSLALSKRLQCCMTITRCEAGAAGRTGASTPPAADADMNNLDWILISKLFGDTLRDISEYLAIIQSYGCSQSTQVTPPADDHTGDTPGPSRGAGIGIIVLLHILSVFLQIVAVSEKLFLALARQLSNMPTGSPASVQTVPGLQLAGFSVRQGSLQTKLLIHATIHQFEMIERILGLPVEFRVTERQDPYNGPFDNDHGRSLLDEVSSCHQWLCVGGGGEPEIQAVFRLRETIKKVQTLVDMR